MSNGEPDLAVIGNVVFSPNAAPQQTNGNLIYVDNSNSITSPNKGYDWVTIDNTTDIGMRGKHITIDNSGDNAYLRNMIATISSVGLRAFKAYEEAGITVDDDTKNQIFQVLLSTDPPPTDKERFEMEEFVLGEV
jgi:hypothetical protein